jgi:FkbM family methyltransferase
LQEARIERALQGHARLFSDIRLEPKKYKNDQMQLLIDAEADCVAMERLGTWIDGGKWVCNPHKLDKKCVAYGFGAGKEISFEEQLARDYGCDAHVFDPSPTSRRIFERYEKRQTLGKGTLTFHPIGLGPVSDDPARATDLVLEKVHCKVQTLSQLTNRLGHTRIDLLKMDIEGSEWSVLDDIFAQGLLKKLDVHQLQIEFHIYDAGTLVRLVDVMEKLHEEGYLLFRKELNPRGIECCAEYAFAQRAFLLD